MRLTIDKCEINVTGYDFKCPTTAIHEDEHHPSAYYFSLREKSAILVNHVLNDRIVTYKIKVFKGKLMIDYGKYRGEGTWQKAGPICQDMYQTYVLEDALKL